MKLYAIGIKSVENMVLPSPYGSIIFTNNPAKRKLQWEFWQFIYTFKCELMAKPIRNTKVLYTNIPSSGYEYTAYSY